MFGFGWMIGGVVCLFVVVLVLLVCVFGCFVVVVE